MAVTTCGAQAQSTGFLGLGDGQQQFRIDVQNQGDVAANATVRVVGLHERDPNARIALHNERVFVEAHRTATITTTIANAQLGGVNRFQCLAEADPVVQQEQHVCPVCQGSGTEP